MSLKQLDVFSRGHEGGDGQVCSASAVLDLCVSDSSVLLSQMQTQLTLVAEVQVTILTLK